MDVLRNIDLDVEYRKYIVLAKVTAAEKAFKEKRIYPEYIALKSEYDFLSVIHKSIKDFIGNIPKYIDSIDVAQRKIFRRSKEKGLDILEEISDFTEKALNYIRPKINEGEELKNIIYNDINVSDIGISSSYKKEGYLFVKSHTDSLVHIYRYKWNMIPSEGSNIENHFFKIDEEIIRHHENLADLKLKLIKKFPNFPVPQTYLIESEKKWPLEATLLPLSREKIMKLNDDVSFFDNL